MNYVMMYEAARKYGGNIPIFFVNQVPTELERIVSDANLISPNFGVKTNAMPATVDAEVQSIQIHYVLVGRDVYRVFVGEDRGTQVVRSIIRIGEIKPEHFTSLYPLEAGLTESQVNRNLRRTLRKLKRSKQDV